MVLVVNQFLAMAEYCPALTIAIHIPGGGAL